jgi:hypothetical protein
MFFLYACFVAYYYVGNIPFHEGAYVPYAICSVSSALCFGVGRKLNWPQFLIGAILLMPVGHFIAFWQMAI